MNGLPLPAWGLSKARLQILEFVTAVTADDGPHYVVPADRIAVFDNDGTLWSERPVVQGAFTIDRIKAMAPDHPEWTATQPYQGVLEGDFEAVAASGDQALGELLMVTHTGITTEEFTALVGDWIATAKHPTTGALYTDMVYQPMLELLAYLRANDFATYIVSGGEIVFMRAFAEEVYGIPPEQVIGSSIETAYEMREEGPALVRQPAIDFVDDGPGKPVAIEHFIGRRPLICFGNSDGDHEMLQWTAAGEGPRLMGLIHHTDGEREWAYDKDARPGGLERAVTEARERDWIVVVMKNDWTVVHKYATDAA